MIFPVSNLFTYYKIGEIMVSKYGHLMLPGEFPVKVTSEFDMTDEAVAQCDVPVLEMIMLVMCK